MSLSILNSVSSLVAENSLAQASLGQQKALQELSTGLKINSSADDAAGLAISAGLQANTTALAQSYANANNGISFLQVADGALSQVNSLLNRAVTLATESASGNLTGQQRAATNAEYQSILTEINQIGALRNSTAPRFSPMEPTRRLAFQTVEPRFREPLPWLTPSAAA